MAEIAVKSTPRRVTIRKRDDFDGYGFNLHAEKGKPGQYVGKVDPNSPAELAGLRENDRIIEVNGADIGSETHKQVVERIKAIPNETTLLVIDAHVFTVTKNGSTPVASPKDDKKKSSPSSPIMNNNNDATSDSSSINNDNNDKNATKTSGTKDNGAVLSESTTTTTENNNTKVTNETDLMISSNNKTDVVEETTTTTKTETGNHHANNNNHHAKSPTTEKVTTETETKLVENNNHGDKNHENNSNAANNNGKERSVTPEAPKSPSNNGAVLNLNMTATELRAKLLAKKKYDPKNDSIDLRKKYDIIEKM